jgi:predicted AlkP superfamily phosphohydrolase/phosphomutase
VLLLGIDGATMRVAGPLMKEGRLPNLAKIAREGVSGPLRSVRPLLSPRIWNSIATGKSADKHGIHAFALEDEQGVQRLYLSADRKAHALWNIASDAGLTVGVVNWWNTYPPERIRGVMISDHLLAREIDGRRNVSGAIPAPSAPVVFPEAWQARLSALLEGGHLPVPFEDPFLGNRELPEWIDPAVLSRRFREDGALVRFALEVEAASDPDLLMVLLPGIDRVSHFLWGNVELPELYPERLRPSPSPREAGAAALKRYYEYTDALVGAVVERFAPDDLVMIVSDHGFEAGVRLAFLTGEHKSEKAIDGVIFARGRGIPAGRTAGAMTVYDVTPTILAWLGLPVAMDMDGGVAGFVQEATEERIPSYDTGPVERISTAPSGADEVLIEQLRALGYIE